MKHAHTNSAAFCLSLVRTTVARTQTSYAYITHSVGQLLLLSFNLNCRDVIKAQSY